MRLFAISLPDATRAAEGTATTDCPPKEDCHGTALLIQASEIIAWPFTTAV